MMIKRVFLILGVMSLMSACTTATETSAPQQPSMTVQASDPATPEVDTASPAPTIPADDPAAGDDIFTQMGITLPEPVCTSVLQPQTAGPYYTPNSPERNILYEEGMEGTRLILAGYVLDQNCDPLPNAWLDFWQADAKGEYDNQGYRLRGHQFTDSQGRYYLETVVPGLYASRPIEHIHVKVKAEGGEEVTSQLYFPAQPVDGLTVSVEDRGNYWVGYFNFVVPQ